MSFSVFNLLISWQVSRRACDSAAGGSKHMFPRRAKDDRAFVVFDNESWLSNTINELRICVYFEPILWGEVSRVRDLLAFRVEIWKLNLPMCLSSEFNSFNNILKQSRINRAIRIMNNIIPSFPDYIKSNHTVNKKIQV